ncbi:MAG: hypothetical protein ABFS18_09170 [Thermodesulfobacteriota bacterium]
MELLEEKKLANSLNIKVTDHSRLIAADRWYVKIVCTVVMTLNDKHFADRHGDGPELFSLIRCRMGNELSMDLVQERNFVDTEVREEVGQELLARISENMTGYLAAESFPTRFFDIRYKEAKKASLVDLARGDNKYRADDDEPVDFSACFRD